MGTRKSKEEINQLLSEQLNKEFKHRGELADTLEIHPQTLRKWISVSDYSFDDFNFAYKKSLKSKIISAGGINYLKKRFKEGCKVKDIAKEMNADPVHTDTVITRILAEEGLTKYDLGYVRYPADKTDYMYNLIEEKGGIPYLLSCKMKGMSIYDIVDEIDGNITREYITTYLRKYNLTFTELNCWEDIYYIPHLKKWRGSFIVDGVVYDTVLCDSIEEALFQVDVLKKNI